MRRYLRGIYDVRLWKHDKKGWNTDAKGKEHTYKGVFIATMDNGDFALVNHKTLAVQVTVPHDEWMLLGDHHFTRTNPQHTNGDKAAIEHKDPLRLPLPVT